MKSSRYQILPRVRKLNILVKGGPVYECTWRDPGDLLQRKGFPLRYISEYRGLGSSPDGAMRNCRNEYLKHQHAKAEAWINDAIAARARRDRPDVGLGPSDDYKATSNLPWWKRLFRV